MEECKAYLQQQRQVCMFLSQVQTDRINSAFKVLGARGVSVFGSSGDGGSHFSFGPFSDGAIADTLNEISCEYNMPVYPTASPYVISVGGTMWSGDSTKPVTWSYSSYGSGGGFSWQFAAPQHQLAGVEEYLNQTQNLPPTTSFNKAGRGSPDISAVGVQGTSQSCPIIAGIFSLITDHRLSQGLPPLGFLGPRIWQVATQYPGEAFEDVVDGNSKTSCATGFPATKGWDPNTGWGRPVWDGMLKHFGSDTVAVLV
jgi:tripeptidyl-peptidase-1